MNFETERNFHFTGYSEMQFKDDKELEEFCRESLLDNFCNSFKREESDPKFNKRYWSNNVISYKGKICKLISMGDNKMEKMFLYVFDEVYDEFKNKLYEDFRKELGEEEYKKRIRGILHANMYEFVKDFEGLTYGACEYLKRAEGLEYFLNNLSYNSEEKMLFLGFYNDVYSDVSKLFEGQIRKERRKKEMKEAKKEKKEPLTIFGIHWLVVILLFPFVLFWQILDDSSKK